MRQTALAVALCLLVLAMAACSPKQTGFPRAADVQTIVTPRPKIPAAALDPNNPTAAANYQSQDRAWSKAVSDAGARICRALVAMGMEGVECPSSPE